MLQDPSESVFWASFQGRFIPPENVFGALGIHSLPKKHRALSALHISNDLSQDPLCVSAALSSAASNMAPWEKMMRWLRKMQEMTG